MGRLANITRRLCCGRLFLKYMAVFAPAFFALTAIAMSLLSSYDVRAAKERLTARVGSQIASIATAIEHEYEAGHADAAQVLITTLLTDPAVACAEYWRDDALNVVLAAPQVIGCRGQGQLEHIALPTGVTNSNILSVRISDSEIAQVLRSLREFSALAIWAAFLLAVVVSGYGFRRSVGRPLSSLLDAIRGTSTTEFKRLAVTKRNDELGMIMRAFSELQDRIDAETRRTAEHAQHLATEIDKHRQTSEKLEIARASAEAAARAADQASRAKSDFLALMSHELRTPLNGILGLSGLLAKEAGTAEQRSFAHVIEEAGNSLLHMINGMLDLSAIEAGKLRLEPSPFDLKELIAGVVELIGPAAQQKGLDVHWQVADDVPDDLINDPWRVRQVLVNLLANAVKFTDRGHVSVEARLVETNDATALVRIEVADTGIGMSQSFLGVVFERFQQADPSDTRRHQGSGLGLAITRDLVELMGGTISAASTLGNGSRFTIELPFEVRVRPTHADRNASLSKGAQAA